MEPIMDEKDMRIFLYTCLYRFDQIYFGIFQSGYIKTCDVNILKYCHFFFFWPEREVYVCASRADNMDMETLLPDFYI